ncbi:translocase of chloroplast 90, chloroplastic-like [Dorcoceras hygrometricum]|uniref:Translocase of chloroplast 90, chloroplastic-like n=1 Tax=Dorcoceras hygrometricum TaxID=472368 RepID=A0A2Z7AGD6_9LAMI|nr:translocase of chloroplast 90, chloroplastic-like [Dorcoceras hygrometricum]
MQHAINNAMKCMRAIKDRIARPASQLAIISIEPLYHAQQVSWWKSSVCDLQGPSTHHSSVVDTRIRSSPHPMIALDFSGTTTQSASHNVALISGSSINLSGSICMHVCQSIIKFKSKLLSIIAYGQNLSLVLQVYRSYKQQEMLTQKLKPAEEPTNFSVRGHGNFVLLLQRLFKASNG